MQWFSLNLALKADMDTQTYIHTRTEAVLYPLSNQLREGIKNYFVVSKTYLLFLLRGSTLLLMNTYTIRIVLSQV